MKALVQRSIKVETTPRVLQLNGMFDVPPMEKAALQWDVNLPLDERDWNVGLIVGPSGCGKSTVARELFPDAYVHGFEWSPTHSILDGFPAGMSIKDITLLLSSVGFSSPPSWARPFHVLSNGEQFRSTLARAISEKPDLCVFDEFTSVVDRQVAKIGSHAVAKTVRKRKQKFVAVTCHYDVEEWLDPDWVYSPAENRFQWRLLQGRPKIALQIRRVHYSTWKLFAPHHYLTAELSKSAVCFCAFVDERPVAFHSYLPFVGRLSHGKAMRGHRSVVLPDFQGVGIGNVMITTLASMWAALGLRVFRNTGHPAEIAGAMRDKNWKLIRAPSRTAKDKQIARRATNRLTASFEYVGSRMAEESAKALSAPL